MFGKIPVQISKIFFTEDSFALFMIIFIPVTLLIIYMISLLVKKLINK